MLLSSFTGFPFCLSSRGRSGIREVQRKSGIFFIGHFYSTLVCTPHTLIKTFHARAHERVGRARWLRSLIIDYLNNILIVEVEDILMGLSKSSTNNRLLTSFLLAGLATPPRGGGAKHKTILFPKNGWDHRLIYLGFLYPIITSYAQEEWLGACFGRFC